MKYNFKKMTPTAKLPTRHTPLSAGVDFYSDMEVDIPPMKSAIISTGISWNPDMAHTSYTVALIIQSRSGLSFKHGIEAGNSGVIDADYIPNENEDAIIHVKLYNYSDTPFKVNVGDKIAQGVLQLIPLVEDVENLDSDRQGKGFGSSDMKSKGE
jgi:dUTP pyrophosphatase